MVKDLSHNENDNKVMINCLDDNYNKIAFEMDKDKDSDRWTQITPIIEVGETKKKDVKIVIVEVESKDGKSTKMVSHAIIY